MNAKKWIAAILPFIIVWAIGSTTGEWLFAPLVILTESSVIATVFVLLFILATHAQGIWPAQEKPIARNFAYSAWVIANLGFCFAALWGDTPAKMWLRALNPQLSADHWDYLKIDAIYFKAFWLDALIVVGIYGHRAQKRGIITITALFAILLVEMALFQTLGFTQTAQVSGALIASIMTVALIAYHVEDKRKQKKKPV